MAINERVFKKYVEEEISELEILEKGPFDIDLEKGLYIGSGVKLVSDSEEDLITVKGMYLKWGDLNGHVSVYGTTRVGKTRLMVSILRQCILRGMNILIVEPKGAVGDKKDEEGNSVGAGQETLSWILQFAEEAGRLRDFRYISPKFSDLSVKFNPLFALTNEEISSLVSTIIPAEDEFFVAMGEQITMCVLLGLDFLERVEGEESINKIIDREYKSFYASGSNIIDKEYEISNPDLAERVMSLGEDYEIENIRPPYRSLVTFSDLSSYTTQEGVQAILHFVTKTTPDLYNTKDPKVISDLNRLKMEAIKALTEMANKDKQYFSKVSSSFNIIMQKLSTGDLGKILCSVKINPLLDRFFSDRGQIIFIQPWPLIYKDTSKAFVRIFFSVITAYLGNIGASGRSPKREICLFVDEGGAVLYSGVEDLFNKAGALGLRIFIFTQSFADYGAVLGEDIAKIINDNTNIKIYMRMNDQGSKELVADSFSTIKRASTKYMGSKLDMRISSASEDIEVLTPAHISDMQKQEFLLQYGEGRYYCCAPFQYDPEVLFKMPEIHMEKSIIKNVNKFQATISKEGEQ